MEAALVLMSPAFFFRRVALAEALNHHKLPASFGLREFVEDGGLMSYGANLNDVNVRLADYVDRILKGANPAETPVERYGYAKWIPIVVPLLALLMVLLLAFTVGEVL